MVDIHTHVLPQIDDGAKHVSESLRMLADAHKQGVRLCVATPHCILHKEEDIEDFLRRRRESALSLAEAAKKSQFPLPDLLLGAEVFLDNNINVFRGIEKLCIGNSPYILVEFPMGKYDPYWGDWLHSMCLRGLRPIIAHIDRYIHLDRMLADFSGLPITYQMNASRMLSFWGRHFTSRILSGSEPCIFGSDMHNTTTRSCNMKEAFTKAKKKFPLEAPELFSLRAKKMLQSEEM